MTCRMMPSKMKKASKRLKRQMLLFMQVMMVTSSMTLHGAFIIAVDNVQLHLFRLLHIGRGLSHMSVIEYPLHKVAG